MKRTALALALLAIASPSFAGPKHFYKDKKFWAGVGVIAASIAADSASTAHARDRGATETNFLLGPHPSNNRLIGFSFMDLGIETGFHLVLRKVTRLGPETKTWDTLGYVTEPVISLATHVPAAVHNWEIK